MSITLVDTNVIVDVLNGHPEWSSWSENHLANCADEGSVAINPLIYAEICAQFDSVEDVDDALSLFNFQRLDIPWDAAFLAGKCFSKYRRSGGLKTSPLPDFYIGAHAAVEGLQLLTRDPKRFRNYFPKLKIIAPQSI